MDFTHCELIEFHTLMLAKCNIGKAIEQSEIFLEDRNTISEVTWTKQRIHDLFHLISRSKVKLLHAFFLQE